MHLEILAALLMLVNVWLVARRSLWNYAFAIAAVSLFFFVFLEARLYAAAGLQVIFLALNLYGLMTWRAALATSGDIAVTRMQTSDHMASLAAMLALALSIGLLLARTTNAVLPFFDSAITATAIAAQFWQARRKLECWGLWILANIGSTILFASQALWFTAGTYAVLLGVAIWGWRQWAGAQAA